MFHNFLKPPIQWKIIYVGIGTVYGNITKKTWIGVIIPEVTMIASSVKKNVQMIPIALVLNVEEM